MDSLGGALRRKNKDNTASPPNPLLSQDPKQPEIHKELPTLPEMPPRGGKFSRDVIPEPQLAGNSNGRPMVAVSAPAAQSRPQVASFPIIGMVNPKRKPRATDQESLPAIETCSRSASDVFDSKIMIWPVVIVAAPRNGLSPKLPSSNVRPSGPTHPAGENSDDFGFIGIEFQPRFDRHFIVTEIAKNGPSDLNEGIMVGDILLAVNGVPIRNLVRSCARLTCLDCACGVCFPFFASISVGPKKVVENKNSIQW